MSAIAEQFWSTLPLGRGVQLLNRDANGLVALSKPAGLLSHPNEPGDEPRSLLKSQYDPEAEAFVWKTGQGSSRLFLLNRLDSATSGVILAAASERLAQEIRALFRQRHIHKVYQALVFGTPSTRQQVWRDLLAVQKRGGQIRTHAGGNVPSEALMRVIRSRPGEPALALIALEPKTGRSHQLRVQCAKRHLPIVGDATYGDFGANRVFAKATGQKRLFLHSLETQFEYSWSGRTHAFRAHAPLPSEFESVW